MVSFLFLTPLSKAIINDNDINFDWITTSIYNENDPNDFEIDDSLNYKEYNNTDYYEHVEGFNDNFSNDYFEDIIYFPEFSYFPIAIFYLNDTYYVFNEKDVNMSLYIYDENLEYVNWMQSNIGNYKDNLINAFAYNGFIYTIMYDYVAPNYFVSCYKLDLYFNYLEEMFSFTSSTYHFYDACYYDDYIYFACQTQSTSYSYVLQYDFEGNLINSENIESNTPYIQGIICYQNKFYILDAALYVDIYDEYLNYIEQITPDYQDTCLKNYAVNNLIFYLNLDGLSNTYLYMLDLNFEEQTYYDKIKNFPDNNGLFDTVDNINITLQEQTNPIGHYDATYSFTNQTGFTGTSINGVDYIGASSSYTAVIIPEIQNHKDVLQVNRIGGSFYSMPYTIMNNSINGTIEFWMYSEQDSFSISLFTDIIDNAYRSTVISYFGVSNKIEIYYSSSYIIVNNIFDMVHIRMDYDCNYDNYSIYINGSLELDNEPFWNDLEISYVNKIGYSAPSLVSGYIDALGINCNESQYILNQNLQYDIMYNGFWNEINIMNENFQEIISIECLNGTYYINGTDTNFNIFFNYSQYVYDTWILNISINQDYQNGTLYLLNLSNSLLFSQDFNCNSSGNIKYIKYVQYYQDSNHFIMLSDMKIYSNDTCISGNNGFMSYQLILTDTTVWSLEMSYLLTLNFYGKYRFWVSNDSYNSEDIQIYQLTNWIHSREQDIILDLSFFDYIITNPYLIVETMNGMYLLNFIQINGSSATFLLYDDRNYVYSGTFTSVNVDTSNSYFYISGNKLYYQVRFNDDNTEYIKLTFNIIDINNENYQLLYTTYLNDTNEDLLLQFKLKENDGQYTNIDFNSYYDSDIEILNQEKITTHIEFIISDNDLQNNLNISGYIEDFTFNYNEQISISLFIENILIMLIPIIIILSLSLSISHVLKHEKNEIVNKKAFFPIFILSSIIVFIIGFFDIWILFVLILSTILYILRKKE